MKTFLCAMCILLILILLIGLNAYYVHSVGDQMLETLSRLPRIEEADCAKTVMALDVLWEQSRHRIGLSVNAHAVEQIDGLIISLKTTCHEQVEVDFEVCREQLVHAIRELQNLERFTIWNIL